MHVKLSRALEVSEVPGRTDIWSGLGQVFLTSVETWVPSDPDMILTVGKLYKFRDRNGVTTEFMALETCPPGLFTESERLAHVEAAGRVSYDQGFKDGSSGSAAWPKKS